MKAERVPLCLLLNWIKESEAQERASEKNNSNIFSILFGGDSTIEREAILYRLARCQSKIGEPVKGGVLRSDDKGNECHSRWTFCLAEWYQLARTMQAWFVRVAAFVRRGFPARY